MFSNEIANNSRSSSYEYEEKKEIVDNFLKEMRRKLKEYPDFNTILSEYAQFLLWHDPSNIRVITAKNVELVSEAKNIGPYDATPFSTPNFKLFQTADCQKIVEFFFSFNAEIPDKVAQILGNNNAKRIKECFYDYKKRIAKKKDILSDPNKSKEMLIDFSKYLETKLEIIALSAVYEKEGKAGKMRPSRYAIRVLGKIISIMNIHQNKDLDDNKILFALQGLIDGFMSTEGTIKYPIVSLITDFYNINLKQPKQPHFASFNTTAYNDPYVKNPRSDVYNVLKKR